MKNKLTKKEEQMMKKVKNEWVNRFNSLEFNEQKSKELILEKPVELTHEEHETLLLPVGKAKVLVQRELDLLGEVKQVMD